MRVADIMTVEVTTTTPETSLRDAARVLATRGISGMPVVDAGGRVVGVLSEADVLAKEERVSEDDRGALARLLHHAPENGERKHDARLVGEAMTAPAVTITPHSSIAYAAGQMLEHGVNRLPVVERERLVGLVSRADLVRAFARSDAQIAADAREQLMLQQALTGDSSTVDIVVTDGDAVLTGAVRRRSDADILPRLIRLVPGIVDVRSELSWSEPD
jgi:CBS domain-containing protein